MAETLDTESTIREYIAQVIHMSLATSKDNKPRVVELHFAYQALPGQPAACPRGTIGRQRVVL